MIGFFEGHTNVTVVLAYSSDILKKLLKIDAPTKASRSCLENFKPDPGNLKDRVFEPSKCEEFNCSNFIVLLYVQKKFGSFYFFNLCFYFINVLILVLVEYHSWDIDPFIHFCKFVTVSVLVLYKS